jgi:hypothetical protein
MRSLFFSSLILLPCIGLAACDDDSTDPDGTGGTGGGGAPATSTSTSSAGGPTTGASTSDAATTSTEIPDPVSSIGANVTDATFGANCQPVVGPDPIQGSIEVTYQNTGTAPGSIPLTEVELMIGGPSNLFVFTMDPDESGTLAAQETKMVTHTKVADSTTPNAADVCNHCGQTAYVTVRWLNEMGIPLEQTVEVETFGCVL